MSRSVISIRMIANNEMLKTDLSSLALSRAQHLESVLKRTYPTATVNVHYGGENTSTEPYISIRANTAYDMMIVIEHINRYLDRLNRYEVQEANPTTTPETATVINGTTYSDIYAQP